MCFLPATVPVAGSKHIATATYILTKDNKWYIDDR